MKKLFGYKNAKTEYTKNMLPQSRKEQFSDILKLQWKKLLLIGLIVLLFSIPLMITSMAEDVYVNSIGESLEANTDVQQILLATIRYKNVIAGINIILYAVLFVGLAGIARIIRQLIWSENVFFTVDFSLGFKQNVFQYMVLGILFGTVVFLTTFLSNLSLTKSGVDSLLHYIPIGIVLVVVVPVVLYVMALAPVYSNTLWQNIKIAIVLYVGSPIKTILLIVACGVVFIPTIIPNLYAHLFGRIVSALLSGFSFLLWTLYVYHRLDKEINPKYYPELVNRGLYLNK